MNFNEMQLQRFELDALDGLGFTAATDIQSKTIPLILEGKDVIGRSKTGSGKTFAYGLPIVSRLETFNKKTQSLIVAPTRELAEQIFKELKKLTKNAQGYSIVPVYGGVSMQRQLQEVRRGAQIIVGTPGRIMDHLRRKTIKLSHLKTLVLDEADEMLNMGFKDDIETILASCNEEHQTVMFSATMPPAILAITKNYMNNPVLIEIEKDEDKVAVKEEYVSVGAKDKETALYEILAKYQPQIAIVFTNTKIMADSLARGLQREGYNALGLHGDMRQGARKSVMNRIKNIRKTDEERTKDDCNILVATDVAARGIDIVGVDIVINYDIPNDQNYYTHRIGRTGRGTRSGLAVSIANNREQVKLLKQLCRERQTELVEIAVACSKDYKVSDISGAMVFPTRANRTRSGLRSGGGRNGSGRNGGAARRGGGVFIGNSRNNSENDNARFAKREDKVEKTVEDKKPYKAKPNTDKQNADKPYAERKPRTDKPYAERKPRASYDRGEKGERGAKDSHTTSRGAKPTDGLRKRKRSSKSGIPSWSTNAKFSRG